MPAEFTLTVKVTADDIDRGTRCDGHTCAVALAVDRALKEQRPKRHDSLYSLLVDPYDVTLEFGREWRTRLLWTASLPAEARAFVELFDDADPAIELPPPAPFDLVFTREY